MGDTNQEVLRSLEFSISKMILRWLYIYDIWK